MILKYLVDNNPTTKVTQKLRFYVMQL